MSNDIIRKRGDGLVAFFVLTFAIAWGLAALVVLFPGLFEALFGSLSAASPVFVVATAGPTIAATILTFARDGWRGLGTLYARLTQWRFGVPWYALILVGVPLVAYLVSRMAGPESMPDLSTPGNLLAFLLLNLILGPLGEELGWRGFAFPRLLQRRSPLAASLILGAIWGVWHLPAFFLSGLPQANLSISVFLISTLCLSLLATWIFLHTGGNVPSIVLFHYMVNISLNLFGVPQLPSMVVMVVAAALVVVLDRQLSWFRHDPAWDEDTAAAHGQVLTATEHQWRVPPLTGPGTGV